MTTTRASKNWFWEIAIAVVIVVGTVASVAWGRIFDSGTHYQRGIANFQSGRYRAAIANYDRALRLEPDAARIYGNRGLAKRILGRYREAVADYDQALRLEPDTAYIYANRAGAKSALGQYQEATADYDQALRLEPDDAYTYAN